jgi:colicin import membrane protein
MIRTAILGALLALPLLGGAQQSPEAAELARINAQRERAEAEYAAQEKACYSRFAVNDCIETARKRRRDALADLRRQEVALNDAERRRRAAERLRDIEARQAEQRTPAPVPVPAPGAAVSRDGAAPPAGAAPVARSANPAPAASSSADRGKAAPTAPAASPRSAARTPTTPTARTAAQSQENAQRYEERVLQAQQHKNRVQQKAAESNKASKPLPVPP